MTTKKGVESQVGRVVNWIRFAGRVHYQSVGDLYRVTSEKHKQAVMLSASELETVCAIVGGIMLDTMPPCPETGQTERP